MNPIENNAIAGGESPARLMVRLPICMKELSVETNHEFTLPDYLPEIKKMLRVTATVEPPESYVGASDAEFSGRLIYHLLYTGADGEIRGTDLPADYSFQAPIEAGEKCNRMMGQDAFADVVPELLVTRVLSPRRVNLRARMRATARAYAFHSLAETLSGSPYGKVERLCGVTDSAVVLRGYARGVVFSDEMIADSTMNHSRVSATEGHVFVNEAIPDDSRVTLRGEILLKLLTCPIGDYSEGDGSAPLPSVIQRRIPFSTEVALDGCDRYYDCRGFGVPTRIAVTEEDGRVIVDVEVTFTAEGQKNERFHYTRDLFSTGAESASTYCEAEFPFALPALNGNFTLSDSLPLEGLGLVQDDRILDVTGELSPSEITENGGKTTLSGEGHFHLLVKKADSGEFTPVDVTLPFRYSIDSTRGERRDLPEMKENAVSFDVISARARQDGQRLSIDAEVSVSIRTAGRTKVEMLESASFGAPVAAKKGCIVLCYPSSNDTLWDVARRYHVSPDSLAKRNGIEPMPDSPMKGVKYVVARS